MSITSFSVDNNMKDGLSRTCKDCFRNYRKKYYKHDIQILNTKQCRHCKQELPIKDFPENTKWNLSTRCVSCIESLRKDVIKKKSPYKECKVCKTVLVIEEFEIQFINDKPSVSRTCKKCCNNRRRELREKKREKINIPDEHKKCRKCFNIKPFNEFNNCKKAKYGKENYCKICKKIYYQEVIKEKKYYKRYTDTHSSRMRSILQSFLRYNKSKKVGKTEEILGYSREAFRLKFPIIEKGMNIDHSIPVSWFCKDTPLNIIHSLDNLELMKEELNFSKHNFYCTPVDKKFYDIAFEWILPCYKGKLIYINV